MPYVNIRITREKEPVTREQKQQLIAGVTDLLKQVINRGPATTVVPAVVPGLRALARTRPACLDKLDVGVSLDVSVRSGLSC